jgi:hypothetical protein
MQGEVRIWRLKIVPLNGRTVQIYGNKLSKSKFYSGRNKEKTEVSEC